MLRQSLRCIGIHLLWQIPWGRSIIPPRRIPITKLPFCTGSGRQRRHKQGLGEVLSGSRKVATPYELTFLDPVPWRSLCEEFLDAKDIEEFKSAIESDYFLKCLLTTCQCGVHWRGSS